MKLSEAIRLGGMFGRPTTRLTVIQRDDDGAVCGVCAIGAAALAV